MSNPQQDHAAGVSVALARVLVGGGGLLLTWHSLQLLSSDDPFFGLLEGLLGLVGLALAGALLVVGTWRMSADPVGTAACVHALLAAGGLIVVFLATNGSVRAAAAATSTVGALGLAAIVRAGLTSSRRATSAPASPADWSAASDLPFDAG